MTMNIKRARAYFIWLQVGSGGLKQGLVFECDFLKERRTKVSVLRAEGNVP